MPHLPSAADRFSFRSLRRPSTIPINYLIRFIAEYFALITYFSKTFSAIRC
jgi:hypothetical protein